MPQLVSGSLSWAIAFAKGVPITTSANILTALRPNYGVPALWPEQGSEDSQSRLPFTQSRQLRNQIWFVQPRPDGSMRPAVTVIISTLGLHGTGMRATSPALAYALEVEAKVEVVDAAELGLAGGRVGL